MINKKIIIIEVYIKNNMKIDKDKIMNKVIKIFLIMNNKNNKIIIKEIFNKIINYNYLKYFFIYFSFS